MKVLQFSEKESNKKIEQLLSKAEAQGFVTLDDILEVFPDAEESISELDELFSRLNGEGRGAAIRCGATLKADRVKTRCVMTFSSRSAQSPHHL